MLFRHPSLRDDGLALPPALFRDGEHRALFEAWQRDQAAAGDDALAEPHQRIAAISLPPYDATSALAAYRSALALLERERLRQAKRQATSALIDSVEGLDQSTVVEQALAAFAADGDDEAARSPEVTLALRDTEAGLRLHRGETPIIIGAAQGDGATDSA